MTTLAYQIDAYITQVNQYHKSYQLVERYIAKALKKHPIGTVEIGYITTHHLEDYRDERLLRVAPSTVKRELTYLQRVFKYSHTKWPEFFQLPQKADRQRDDVPTREELDIMIAAADTHMANFIRVASATGMRRSELVRARLNHIRDNTLHIPITKTDKPRTIPISSNTRAILLAEAAHHGAGKPFPYHPTTYTHKFKRLVRSLGMPQYVLHSLRHFACTSFFEAGMNPMQVSAISGHQDLKMLKRYTHLKAASLVDLLPS
ncbi:MAG: site-specific integrase [Pseudomonadales bacterium]|nr:site-specific integrase [Pseudomonadales bacterium]